VLLIAGCTSSNRSPQATNPQPAALSPEVVSQIEALLVEKQARTPVQKKISSQLLYQRDGRLPGYTGKLAAVKPLGETDSAGRVLVDLKGQMTPEVLDLVSKRGGAVITSSAGSARAWLGLQQIEAVAAHPGIQAIRPAVGATTNRANSPRHPEKFATRMTRAEQVAAAQRLLQRSLYAPRASAVVGTQSSSPTTFAGSVTSQGDHAVGADVARKFYGTDGTGVTVCVLSDSDDFKEDAIATGDLPADTFTVPGQDGRPGTGEGTAMMEIVHDLAPGAKIGFATAFTSAQSFADNIHTLRFTYHCDIIVDDVIYYDESPYEDDIIAQAVDDVTADGALYFSSAGNQGNEADGTSGTWEGDFLGLGPDLPTLPAGYSVHNWGDSVIGNRIEVGGGPLVLQWSDPGTMNNPASSNDYDLFLLDADLRNVVLAATDVQNGSQEAFEWLPFLIPPGYRVVVAKHAGEADRAIRVIHFNGELGLATGGATYGHSTAKNAIGVAAVDVAEAAGGQFPPGVVTPVELFSADGWRQMFYKKDNTRIRGGVTFGSGGGETRFKPDLAAPDGVSTTNPNFFLNPFFGTSAAAPHAGAVAALLKSAVPTAKANRLRNAMLAGAIDIAAEGQDHQSGKGVISALEALSQIGAEPAVFLSLVSATTTGSSGGFVVPGGTGSISVQLLNEGGAQASSVVGTLSSSTPGVTIINGTSTFPSLAPGATGTNTTPFTFSVSSAVPCGQGLSFTLSVSFTGRGTSPTLFTIKVQTGVPSSTPVVANFNTLTAIPDDDPAGVNIPITVSGAGGISSVTFSINGTACTAAAGATTVGIDHSWVGDLIATLTSPAGTTVTLMSRPGGTGNSGNNFCQTVLSDSASTSIQNIAIADAPWTGTFRPAQPLSAFSGEIANGTWVLNVSDNAFIDTGNVRDVSLAVTGFSCP